MTKPQLDEAKRLAEGLIKEGGEPKVLDICEAFLYQSQELERLREIISSVLYNFECDKECQCCNYNNGQIEELRKYALEKQIQS